MSQRKIFVQPKPDGGSPSVSLFMTKTVLFSPPASGEGSVIDVLLLAQELMQLIANSSEPNIEDMAIPLIKQNPWVVLEQIRFTEKSGDGQKWVNPISPLQYAAWAGHFSLAEEMYAGLPNDKPKALQQLKDLAEYGTEHGMPLKSDLNKIIIRFEQDQPASGGKPCCLVM